MNNAMLINYGLCTGCDTCEIACMKEKGLPKEEWGIRVKQIGPSKLAGKWEWDYVPVPSSLCNLCAERLEAGKPASCELHCLAQVIEIVPVDQVATRMAELGGKKISVFMP